MELPFIGKRGLRIGLNEVTRLGMTASEIKEIAMIFYDVIVEGGIEAPRDKVRLLRKRFPQAKFCLPGNLDVAPVLIDAL